MPSTYTQNSSQALARRSTISRRKEITPPPNSNLALIKPDLFMRALTGTHSANNCFMYTIGSTSIKNEKGEKVFKLENPIYSDNLPNIALSGFIYTDISRDGRTMLIKFEPNLHETLVKFRRQTDNAINKLFDNPVQFLKDNAELITILSGEIISLSKTFLLDKDSKQLASFATKNPDILLSIILKKDFIVPVALALSPAVIKFLKSFRPAVLAEYPIK
jgi:hypothetical protein